MQSKKTRTDWRLKDKLNPLASKKAKFEQNIMTDSGVSEISLKSIKNQEIMRLLKKNVSKIVAIRKR